MFEILQKFVDLGAIVVLPILIFIFGLLLGTPARKAFNAGITVGIGFVGLNLVVELLSGSLGKAAQAMVERFGLQLTTLDVGWPAAAAISYGTLLGSLAIPIGIAVNILLLFVGSNQNLNGRYVEFLACSLCCFSRVCCYSRFCSRSLCYDCLPNNDLFLGRYYRPSY